MSDQNLRRSILKKKARLAEIDGPSQRVSIAKVLAERGASLRTPLDPEVVSSSPDADLVRASFGSSFLKKAELLRDSSINEARDTIQRDSEIISDQDALFEFNHETLHSGLMAWLASVGRLVHRQVSVLTQIVAKGRGSYCERGQEARWARMEVEGLLLRSLGQDLACGKAWIDTELSAVQYWSRTVCGVKPVTDLTEPWVAPAWYEAFSNASLWIEEGRPERLTVENTERAVELYQTWFSSQLREDLNNAEDDARVELASRGEKELVRSDSLPPSNEPEQKASPLSMRAKLPAKKRDLSQYLDAAGLTDRQHECLSLTLEYELPKSAIARRLRINRKTVDEHIAAGKKRLDIDLLREKLAKNRATTPTY